LTITASCPMDLQYFPMDRQLCYIEIEIGHTMSDIRYKWNDGLNSVQISSDVSLPQFKVLGHRQKQLRRALVLFKNTFFFSSTGNYSRLACEIQFVRSMGVTTVLTMTTLMASTNAALPKISYVKSIDVYLGACFFMVFASLL
ncbi:Gamma-aminobutyric acid A receptor subunit 1, partial [Caligus rogercresseyi]